MILPFCRFEITTLYVQAVYFSSYNLKFSNFLLKHGYVKFYVEYILHSRNIGVRKFGKFDGSSSIHQQLNNFTPASFFIGTNIGQYSEH